MEDYNFVAVKKGSWGLGNPLPDNIVRVGNKSMGISETIAQNFTTTAHKTSTGVPVVNIAFGYDPEAKALKVYEDERGFYARRTESASGQLTSALVAIPAYLRRLGLQTGDYVKVDGTSNIFKLAQ